MPPRDGHTTLTGDEHGQLECPWCEKMKPAADFFGCETCGLHACRRCLEKHEPCDGTHPEGFGQTPQELLPADGYQKWTPPPQI